MLRCTRTCAVGRANVVNPKHRFLLKYETRDTVELLASGKGGVSEAKNAIAQYEEKSPLYGLIMFRRRKVLIKYIPDGTSRLLQGMFPFAQPRGSHARLLICV